MTWYWNIENGIYHQEVDIKDKNEIIQCKVVPKTADGLYGAPYFSTCPAVMWTQLYPEYWNITQHI